MSRDLFRFWMLRIDQPVVFFTASAESTASIGSWHKRQNLGSTGQGEGIL
jgi:hypothetical protein